MFTATMPVWVCIVFIIPLALLVVAISLIAWRIAAQWQNAKWQRDRLNTENAMLHKAQKILEAARMQVFAENADLREALQEAMAEIKALQMNTVEVPEVTPEPMKPPRGGRGKGKAGAQ